MQNEEGQNMDLYIPRKCSDTNRLITSKDHASVQINVRHLDESGRYTGQFSTFDFCGFVRPQVKKKIKGHNKRITGLAFLDVLNVLVSAGADSELCVWNTSGWEIQISKQFQIPAGRVSAPLAETRVQFHKDQTHLLALDETQIAVYEAPRLESPKQRATASHAESKSSVERLHPHHKKRSIMADKEPRRHDEKQTDTSEETKLKEHRTDDKDSDETNTKQTFDRTLEDSLTELFHQDLHGQTLCLRDKVKERLSNSEDYQPFLKCIDHYCTDNIMRPQLQVQVNLFISSIIILISLITIPFVFCIFIISYATFVPECFMLSVCYCYILKEFGHNVDVRCFKQFETIDCIFDVSLCIHLQ